MAQQDNYKTESVSGLQELLKFRGNPLAYLRNISIRGVDIRQITIGKRRVFFVNHPTLIRDVLVTHDWNFIKGRGLRASKPVFGSGLLTSEGELHRRQRRLAQPAFHSERLAGYARTMVNLGAAASSRWSEGERIAIDQEMMRLTLQIVGRTLFTADVLAEAREIGNAVTNALHEFRLLNSPLVQTIQVVRRWAARRASKSRHRFEHLLRRIISEHRAYPERYADMLSMLMASDGEMGTGYMSDELLLDEALTIFLAGHETTANALTWAWYLLAQHPAAEQTLHEEIEHVLNGRLPSPEDMVRLHYTGQVFREALRLYPPAWIIGREAVTGYRLGSVDVPAGSTLMMSPYAIHRDPRFWHDPETFAPERWKEGAADQRPKFAFFPFGAGSRVCIGEHFATMEGVLLIAVIAQHWRLRLTPQQEVGLSPQITLRPRPSISMVALGAERGNP
ncbi:MAG TPA: cytochrome P450 [Terracidiphilus sp.]|nr:cytochrome P450 [Terracidiphilus sp.]